MTKRPVLRCLAIGLSASLTLPAQASTLSAVLDFEGFLAGQIIDDEYAVSPPPGSNLSAVNLSSGPNVAIIFDTAAPTGGDIDLAAPFDSMNPALPDNYDPGNVLIIQERNNCDLIAGFCSIPDDEGTSPAGEIEILFNSPIILTSIDFFDIEFNENANDPDSQIRLFDASDNEILANTFFVPNTSGDNMWDQLVFDVPGVKRVLIELNGSGAIDNVAYVVPVPAAAWLFCSALGMLGWMRRQTGRRHSIAA